MTHGSLFSGIGGFDLAAQWMGWENKFHCEWNEFGQRILHHYWPNAELFTDITKSDFTKYANQIDILTGGFPCQPYSSAGKRLGKEDERHLWPEMLRAIREIAPTYVVGENVRGLLNWNGGMVFDEVCADLETLGYQVAPYLIPACAVNAPHKRERIWFVAYNNSIIRRERWSVESTEQSRYRESDARSNTKNDGNASDTDRTPTKHKISTRWNLSASEGNNGNASDTDQRSEKSSRTGGSIESNGGNGYIFTEQCRDSQTTQERQKQSGRIESFSKHTSWEIFPTQSPICGGDDGLPTELDGITFSKWRNESIKAYGNAVVPQVVYQIFKAIQAYEQSTR